MFTEQLISGASLVLSGSPANTGDTGLIPRWGISPEEGNGNRLQCSCQDNPTDRGAWRARIHGIAKSRTWLSVCTHTVSLYKQSTLLGSKISWWSKHIWSYLQGSCNLVTGVRYSTNNSTNKEIITIDISVLLKEPRKDILFGLRLVKEVERAELIQDYLEDGKYRCCP